MRHETLRVLSAYLIGKASLDLVRHFIEDVNWDDPNIPMEERSLLLKIEAYLAGMDEGLTDESDLQDLLSSSIHVIWVYQSLITIISGTGNERLSGIWWSDPIPIGAP